MKKVTILAVLIIAALTFGAANLHSMSGKPKDETPFAETAGYKKVDLNLRNSWQDSKDEAILECLLKTSASPTEDQKEALAKAGFKARTFIGKIITGSVKRGNLQAVANLDFVVAMEASTPLSLKKK